MSKKPESAELIIFCQQCRRKYWDSNETYVNVSAIERSSRQEHLPLSAAADLAIERDRKNCSFQLIHKCNRNVGKVESSFGDKRLGEQRQSVWGPSNWKQNWMSCPCKPKKN